MKNNLLELKESLPKQCCSFCTHLSLDGPNDDYKYNIKCIIFNSIPKIQGQCEYFEPEHTDLNTLDLDDMYICFLDTCLRVSYEDYLKSIHWKLFKETALDHFKNSCSICSSNENLNVYHINPALGRESFEDVCVLCSNCASKFW
ncbi:MAG: hypothetical protein ACRDA3_04180 [Peptostreptococcaceae bacterium]